MNPEAARLLDGVADAFNPLLGVLAVLAPLLARPPKQAGKTLRYYLATGAALALVYLIKALDEALGLWSACGLDYSTHTAVAVALTLSLVMYHRRWLGPLATVLCAYGVLVLGLGYHHVSDILSSAVPSACGTGMAHWLATRRAPER